MKTPEQEIIGTAGAGSNVNPFEQEAMSTSKQEAICGSAIAGGNEKIRQRVLKICYSN
jgi:hypothetical protein